MFLGAESLICGPLDAVVPSKAPTSAPAKSPTKAPTPGSKAPTAAPIQGSKTPTKPTETPTVEPSLPDTVEPSLPGTDAPSVPPAPTPTPGPISSNGMTVKKCLRKVKNQCNCVLFAKGEDCATDVIRNKCNFTKKQRRRGAKEKVLDRYANYCEC
jgi:hypothetical protein